MSDYPDIVHGVKPGHLIHRPAHPPLATYTLFGLNCLVFAVMVFLDASTLPPLRALLERVLTGMSTDPELLLRLGASFGPYTRRGEYWRLVAPMFLHIGLIHLALNNWSLYILGQFLEPIYGYGRFAFLYVFSGMGSALVSMSMSDRVSAGASGAIFGIAGVMLVAGFLHRHAIPRQWARVFGIGMAPVIVLNLALGLALRQWIDNWAHLGGLLCGCALALVIPPPRRDFIPGQPMAEHSNIIVAFPAAIVALAAVLTVQNFRAYSAMSRLILQGQLFQIVKRDDWAQDRFRRAAALLPRDEHPHLALGALYMVEKKWPDAIRELELAQRLGSVDLPDIQLRLAQAYEGVGDSAKAREYVQAAEKQFPDDAEAQTELALNLEQLKFEAEAARAYERAVQLNPKLAVAQNNLAWLYATTGDPKLKNPKLALEHAKIAVEQTRWRQAFVIDTLAEALFVNQQYDEAVKAETQALVLEPRNAEYAARLARFRQAASVNSK